jgi:hypothetical protein
MSPMLVRIFTLVGMALAAVSLQMKARAEPLPEPVLQSLHAAASLACGSERRPT